MTTLIIGMFIGAYLAWNIVEQPQWLLDLHRYIVASYNEWVSK